MGGKTQTQTWLSAPSAPICWVQSLTDVNLVHAFFTAGGNGLAIANLYGSMARHTGTSIAEILGRHADLQVTAPWTAPHFRVPVISYCPPSTPQSLRTYPLQPTLGAAWSLGRSNGG